MDPRLLKVFQEQVKLQCIFLLRAARELNQTLKVRDTEGIFFSIQNLLTAGANVSKALWGPGGRLHAERKPLRDSIGIADTSALRDVNMRNNFEHFDDRLDRWRLGNRSELLRQSWPRRK
jgi:hypothetical protein